MPTITEVFSSNQLADNAYYEYSNQFLSQEENLEIADSSGTEESEKIRAKILCKSGKDPFSPPENSLAALGSTVDTDRVNSCFKKAHEIYQKIIKISEKLEPARLYKLGWATEATELAFKKFDQIVWKKILDMETEKEFLAYMAELKKSDDHDERVIYAALYGFQRNIVAIFDKKYTKSDKRKALNALKIKKSIINNLSCFFFRPRSELVPGKSYEELQACDAVYDPKDSRGMVNHSWGTNFAWVLAHIKKGNHFIICADVLTNKTRAKYSDTPSAFFREICVVLKAGYSLCKTGGNIVLKPIELTQEHMQRCDSTGSPGDGVNPSYAEVDEVHRLLKSEEFNECENFECRFIFENGLAVIQDLKKYKMPFVKADDLSARMSAVLQSTRDLSIGALDVKDATITRRFDQGLVQQATIQSQKKVDVKDSTQSLDDMDAQQSSKPHNDF